MKQLGNLWISTETGPKIRFPPAEGHFGHLPTMDEKVSQNIVFMN
jgi:hypothetical protein